jgi:hypothetical protein
VEITIGRGEGRISRPEVDCFDCITIVGSEVPAAVTMNSMN